MSQISSIKPKAFWEFFTKTVKKGEHVALHPKLTTLLAKALTKVEEPPKEEIVMDAYINKDEFVVFLQMMVALNGKRPILMKSEGVKWRVLIGPKPKG